MGDEYDEDIIFLMLIIIISSSNIIRRVRSSLALILFLIVYQGICMCALFEFRVASGSY